MASEFFLRQENSWHGIGTAKAPGCRYGRWGQRAGMTRSFVAPEINMTLVLILKIVEVSCRVLTGARPVIRVLKPFSRCFLKASCSDARAHEQSQCRKLGVMSNL